MATRSSAAQQESYIRQLADRNRTQNTQTSRILLAIPLLATIPYLTTATTAAAAALPTCLALSSLAATAYLLHRLPPAVTGLRPLDDWAGTGGAAGARGPLDRALPYLNGLLAGVLAFWGAAVAYKASRFDGGGGGGGGGGGETSGALAWPVMCSLPAGVYAVVLLAKVVMAGVDPEKELSALRYDYKGA
ncbi:hypothetical protein ISF_01807 [Cordyceps fumosorosea ARSEF 2679]|uniref:Uncharacterized protein n=1 Tax=Cordyceps fumosorosea (strain ARSEF 2679) TaxID=1081104 RepID=A0A168CDJ6_CORFA|nr:hypothetical protein ISF_01807 [Cordyceps fumosorosea ARSEF 2679]OAA71256.1 hypothetical protein ISF_01807 [Cordyceps fumosorosea ARSEF 2679]